MDKITVIDDFLSPIELEKAFEIINSKKWNYQHKSNGKYDHEISFWSVPLDDEIFFTEHVKKAIEKYFSKRLEIHRVYANAQTYGQDGTYHIDDDDEKSKTFVLYLNKIPKHDMELACGHIYFKIPDLKYKICFEPFCNRGIFFPSNYMHKATAFSRFIMDMRICIAFKLREIV